MPQGSAPCKVEGHALNVERAAFFQISLGVLKSGLRRCQIQIRGFRFLRELLADGLLDLVHVDSEQARDHAHVHHVLHELAQLSFGADLRDDLVVGNRVENQVIPQLVQRQRIVVEHRCTRCQRHDILRRGLGIHRDEEIDFLLAPDVTILVRPNGVPGRQSRDV